jgi:hypothetical protein
LSNHSAAFRSTTEGFFVGCLEDRKSINTDCILHSVRRKATRLPNVVESVHRADIAHFGLLDVQSLHMAVDASTRDALVVDSLIEDAEALVAIKRLKRTQLLCDLDQPLSDHSSQTRIRTRYGLDVFRSFLPLSTDEKTHQRSFVVSSSFAKAELFFMYISASV